MHVNSKKTRCLMSTEAIRLIREGGKGLWRRRRGRLLYLSLHCHHQNDSCIKMGSDESHFNVSLTVRDKVTRQCPETTIFEEKGEPKRIRTEVPLLTSLTPYCWAKPAHRSGAYYWLLLHSAVFCSQADSLRPCHVWFQMSDCMP